MGYMKDKLPTHRQLESELKRKTPKAPKAPNPTKPHKLLVRVRDHLYQGERVLVSLMAAYETKRLGTETVRKGIVVATDRRIVFYAKRLTGYDLKHFPYEAISSIESGRRAMGNYINLIVSGNEINMKWIHADTKAFLKAIQDQRAG